MSNDQLPDEADARVSWVIRAPTQAELQRRYDLWAEQYDSDLGQADDYVAPFVAAEIAKTFVARDAHVLDAGAGTGLVGVALKDAGFTDVTGLDFSAGMLAIAAQKNVYRETIVADLGQQTALDDNSFDAVITVGTTSQMPSYSLVEFLRVVRPGGHIIFATWVKAFEEQGYADLQRQFETEGRLALRHRGEPFQGLPATEPEIVYEIWVFDVLA